MAHFAKQKAGAFTQRNQKQLSTLSSSLRGGSWCCGSRFDFFPREGWRLKKKLNFYNWDTYIGETTLDDFRDASGIEVSMDLFVDNDELFAKLKKGILVTT